MKKNLWFIFVMGIVAGIAICTWSFYEIFDFKLHETAPAVSVATLSVLGNIGMGMIICGIIFGLASALLMSRK